MLIPEVLKSPVWVFLRESTLKVASRYFALANVDLLGTGCLFKVPTLMVEAQHNFLFHLFHTLLENICCIATGQLRKCLLTSGVSKLTYHSYAAFPKQGPYELNYLGAFYKTRTFIQD